MRKRAKFVISVILALLPLEASAAEAQLDLTASVPALIALAVFALAYLFVIAEEVTELRKSIPVVLAAGMVWVLVAIAAMRHGDAAVVARALRENLLEYGELLLFLLAAMTYVNTLQERNVFAALRSYLIARRFSLRAVFWITGCMAFVLSPCLDNLTTALVMGAVALTMGGGNGAFVVPACINIVVAANAVPHQLARARDLHELHDSGGESADGEPCDPHETLEQDGHRAVCNDHHPDHNAPSGSAFAPVPGHDDRPRPAAGLRIFHPPSRARGSGAWIRGPGDSSGNEARRETL
jgi:hypothetical protein